jgi:hypothetical protein
VAVSAVVAVMAAIPAAAATASTGTIVIDGVSSPAAESGLLSIQAEATSSITSLSAEIYSGTTAELALPASDFTLSAGGPTDGIWTLTTPITQSQLPLGTYTVEVTASDSGGDTVSDVTASGELSMILSPTVTMSASTTTLSWFQQSVTFSGTVTAAYPDGTVQPVPDQQVWITGDGDLEWSTTTTSAGTYSITVTPNPLQDFASFAAYIPPTATIQETSSPTVPMTYQTDPVQISVSLSSPVVNYGQPVTFAGTAQIESDGTWQPFANSTIDVTGTTVWDFVSLPGITVSTNASGQFSVSLPAAPTTTWAASPPASPYLAFTGSQVYTPEPNETTLTVALPTDNSISVHYTPTGQVFATGCTTVAPAASAYAGGPYIAGTLQLQYSRNGTAGWRTLGTLDDGGGKCGPTGTFSPSALAGYYRVSYSGSLQSQPSVSRAVHAATVPTRVTDFSISPGSVSGHGRITLTGRLQQKSRGWRALGGARVTVYVEVGNKWYWYRHLHVSNSGSFRISFADPVTAHWAVGYDGNDTHLESLSRIIYVDAAGTNPGSSGIGRVRQVPWRAGQSLLFSVAR